MGGMRLDRSQGPIASIVLLVFAAGDSMILDSRITAMTHVGIHSGEILLRQFLANIAVKITISGITRIALASAPNLLAGFAIARKDGRARRSIVGREDGKTRTRLAKHQSMRV